MTGFPCLVEIQSVCLCSVFLNEEEEEIFIYTGYYLQLELIFKAALLKQINITYIHKEKQDSGMRHYKSS